MEKILGVKIKYSSICFYTTYYVPDTSVRFTCMMHVLLLAPSSFSDEETHDQCG